MILKVYSLSFFFIFINWCFTQETSFQKNNLSKESLVTLHIKIPISEISKIANYTVKDLVYEDSSYENNQNDLLKLKIWKSAPIQLIGGNEQNIIIEVPIKVWASKGISTLGFVTYQETTFETILYFSAQISLNTNWKITTKTQSKGFKWINKPILDFGLVKIPITNIVEKYLKKEQDKFCIQIDGILAENLDFQKYATFSWNSFSSPFYINPDYNAWLKLLPTKVLATPLQFNKDQIQTTIGIQCISETYIGVKPKDSPLIKTAPDFLWCNNLSEDFTLTTHLSIPMFEINKFANELLLNKTFELDEKKSVIVKKINTQYENGKLLIETLTEGAVNGISIISAVPIYDHNLRKIVLSDTKFRLKTKNILEKAGVIIFQNKITKKIEQEFGIPTHDLEDNAKKSIEQSFNTEYFKGLKLSGKVLGLEPKNIVVNTNEITAEIDTRAKILLIFQDFLP